LSGRDLDVFSSIDQNALTIS